MIIELVIGIAVGLVVAVVVVAIVVPRLLRTASDQLLSVAREKLGTEKQEIAVDLSNKKQMIEELVKQIKVELDKTNEQVRSVEKDRLGAFSGLQRDIDNQRKITEQLRQTTESLSKVLSSNQMRGQWGEKVANDLLLMSGFVKGVDFEFNKEQETGKRPDFTVFLPDKTKINIDVKFPYQNLKKMTETQDKATKTELSKLFERDVREKVRQVTSRDYINPEDNTVDFVILFIPNEMVFSYIYERMSEVWVDAMKQKVVLAGPFTFTAVLRMVRQAHENFRYQKNVQKIIGYIKTFETEFEKYNEEFMKFGERIESLSKQYHIVSSTRTNQLMRSVEKIKIEEDETHSKPPLLH